MRTFTLLGGVAIAAAACGGGGGGGGLEVEAAPTSGPPGTQISVTVSGCTANAGGGLFDDATNTEVEQLQFEGLEHATVTVPESAAPGAYSVRVNCEVSAPEQEGNVVRTELEVRSAEFEVTA